MNKSSKIWDFCGCNHTPHNKQWELVNFEWNNIPNWRTIMKIISFTVQFRRPLLFNPFNVLSYTLLSACIFYIHF